jgi:heptaprenyl diphosphate synthase
MVQAVMKRFITHKQIWACGAVGAVFHNIGQIIAAILVTGTPAIAAYLPVLTIVGVITGIITGLIAQFTVERLRLHR